MRRRKERSKFFVVVARKKKKKKQKFFNPYSGLIKKPKAKDAKAIKKYLKKNKHTYQRKKEDSLFRVISKAYIRHAYKEFLEFK